LSVVNVGRIVSAWAPLNVTIVTAAKAISAINIVEIVFFVFPFLSFLNVNYYKINTDFSALFKVDMQF